MITPQKHPIMQTISNLRIVSPAIRNPRIEAQNGAVFNTNDNVETGNLYTEQTIDVKLIVPTMHLAMSIFTMCGLT